MNELKVIEVLNIYIKKKVTNDYPWRVKSKLIFIHLFMLSYIFQLF